MDVKFDKYSLIIDGKRTFIKSGALHYFKTIGEDAWRDRLSKLKAGGYNCVDLYLCWSFHSPAPHEYDFTGYKDISKLFKIVKEMGLYAIVRPGPYINAEISAGGIPYWLLKEKDVIPRNRQNGDYKYSKVYMDYLREWYSQVLPIVVEYNDIIIAYQIENEYSTNECETEYMEELYQIAREAGITAPIFHNDAYIAGLYADVVDIYACDLYPYINPKGDWKKDNFAFGTLDNLEGLCRTFKENSPIFIAELQAGWFDKWLGVGYDKIREDLNWQHINIMTKTALSQGATMFNHYMAIGGTNILDMASDDVYTSYDFAAPISELGLIKENYHKAKEINYFLDAFDFSQTEPVDSEVSVQENCYYRERHDLINNCNWVFVRNFNTCEARIDKFNIDSFDMKLFPKNLKLRTIEITESGLEIFTKLEDKDNQWIFLISDEKNYINIKDLSTGEIKKYSGDREDFEILDFGATKIMFLKHKTLCTTWKYNDNLIFGADFIYHDGHIAIKEDTILKFFSPDKGIIEKKVDFNLTPLKLKLTDFDVSFCAPEIEPNYDCTSWKTATDKTDSFESGIFSEFVWYKGKITNRTTEISINARHIFAIYLNGHEILNRNSYKYDNLISVDEFINVGVNPAFFNDKEEGEITILVQNLGFDKGFTNDLDKPRGLISFKTDSEEEIFWRIRGRISLDKREFNEKQAPYLAMLSKKFEICEDLLSSKSYSPIILDMEHTPFRRATIFLNDVKIGRYIRHNSEQTKFYLPNEFLKNKNEIKIVVWEKSHRISDAWDFKKYLESVIIRVESFKTYQIL
ncbi:MAG: hypothetical protein E7Z91_05205 [Cyanobacteria bacterium SIG30]|nr:hypothetical protein [Cyanobacteria bacterium SIG30]